jgi:putative endonuclease
VFANFFKRLQTRNRPSPSRTTAQIGSDGEAAAVKHLSHKGLDVLERNWSCKVGEIDIICRDRRTWVFVEVKSSHALAEIPPEARVNWEKRRRLRRLAKYYLGHKFATATYRFDVISVWWEDDETKIRHIEHAF